MPSPSEIALFLRAMPLAMAAQDVKNDPLPEVIGKLRRLAGRGSSAFERRDPPSYDSGEQRGGGRVRVRSTQGVRRPE